MGEQDERIIKGLERLLINSGDRKSGTAYDFIVQFPSIDNVVNIEWSAHTLGTSTNSTTTSSGTYNVPTIEQQGTDSLEIDSFSATVAGYSTVTNTVNAIQNGPIQSQFSPSEQEGAYFWNLALPSTIHGLTPMTLPNGNLTYVTECVTYPPMVVSSLATSVTPSVATAIPGLSLRGLRELQYKPSPGSEQMNFSFSSTQGGNSSPLYLVQLDSWGTNTHSSGIAYWRALDAQSNQRTFPEWLLFPTLKEPKKVNQFRMKVYNADGTVANDISDWQIELELYTALHY